MALLTSLYLCSRTVYAAVGTPTGSGARVVAAAQTELPEGCLINGVITNEADLTAALKEFLGHLPVKQRDIRRDAILLHTEDHIAIQFYCPLIDLSRSLRHNTRPVQ